MTLTTLVNGVDIHPTLDRIGTIFRVPCSGIDVYAKGLKEQPTLDHVAMIDVFRKFKNDPTAELESSLQQKDTPPIHKALCILVRRSVVPRLGRRIICNLLDLVYMECLETGVQINFPGLFLKHLAYVKSSPKHNLVYGA